MRIFASFLFLFIAATASAQEKLITLEDLWRDGTFAVKSVSGFSALKDGEHYTDLTMDSSGYTIREKSLLAGSLIKTLYKGKLPVEEYILSEAQDKILLFTGSENIYRRSILHYVYIYDIASGRETILDTAKVLHATFSPDGSKVAYVKDNNLYYKDLASGKTVGVTSDGARNKIINGNCDWVYEEEFEFSRAYQWSPDGKYLAYYHFDETGVPQYTMTV